MPLFRELITQASADTREKFIYWCIHEWAKPSVTALLRTADCPGLADTLEHCDDMLTLQQGIDTAFKEMPPSQASRDRFWYAGYGLQCLRRTLYYCFDDPTLDNDLRARYIAVHAGATVSVPNISGPPLRDKPTLISTAKLHSLVEIQALSSPVDPISSRYSPPLKFREFDRLFQQSTQSTREHFVSWCIDEWARPAVIEMLYEAEFPDYAHMLEGERDWVQLQRLVLHMIPFVTPYMTVIAGLYDSEDLIVELRRGKTKEELMEVFDREWHTHHLRHCSQLRLRGLGEALYWFHNLLIPDEGFRIRNLAFCAAQAALTPVPSKETPNSDDPDAKIAAITSKLRELFEQQDT